MKKHTYILLLAFVLMLFSSCDKKRQYAREGNRAYNKKSYLKAEEKYNDALKEDSAFVPALYNLGNTFYMSSDSSYKAAIESYNKVLNQPIGKTKKDTLKYANTLYNRGNSFFNLSQMNTKDSNSSKYLSQAAKDYQQSLVLNSTDTNAKYNLALCLWLMKNDNQNNNDQNNQQMQQMLEAMKINEKKTLEKTKSKPQKSPKSNNDKDW